MKRLPSLLRIIKVDYVASLGVIFPLVTWGLALAARFLTQKRRLSFDFLHPS